MGAPVTTVDPSGAYVKSVPDVLITGGGEEGIAPRIRVDNGQTGFFAGRFFRSYKEAIIPTAGQALSLRFTSAVNFILWSQNLTLTQGAVRLEAFNGAITPSGTWTNEAIIGVNRMTEVPTPVYTSQITIQSGGSFTGGTPVDLLFVRSSAQNATAQNAGGGFTERGLPAGTYYIRISTLTGGLVVNDAAQLIYAITWEERP